jgi:hypothetical protein
VNARVEVLQGRVPRDSALTATRRPASRHE